MKASTRALLYDIGIIICAMMSVGLAGLAVAGIITIENVQLFFIVLALCVSGFGNIIAKLHVTPDKNDDAKRAV